MSPTEALVATIDLLLVSMQKMSGLEYEKQVMFQYDCFKGRFPLPF
jgi:hypothetical protein